MLAKSGCIERIQLQTNGRSIGLIEPDVWEHLYVVYVSTYPETDMKLLEFFEQQHTQIHRIVLNEFRTLPFCKQTGTIPCDCQCTGPMYVAGLIDPLCGPAGLNAYEVLHKQGGCAPVAWLPIQKKYMELWPRGKTGCLPLCEACTANPNVKTPMVKHTIRTKERTNT